MDRVDAVQSAQRVKKITDSLISLPTLPTVTSKILELVDNPKTSAGQLSSAIMQDQVLTAKILKMANSAFYGFPREISTVKLAIVVLGFEKVKEMGLSLSVLTLFRADGSSKYFDISLFWQHAIAVGAATRVLARETCYRLAGEAFVAGLLHDLGKIILNQYLAKEFAEIQSLVHEKNHSLAEAERKILGVDHAEVGAWLAERWNLPLHLVEAIKFHEHPEFCPKHMELPLLVYLGNFLAHRANLGKSGSKEMGEIPASIYELAYGAFGLTPESLLQYLPQVENEYAKANSIFSGTHE